ncbi:MAG: T9SS type A sorting domain-containing protein [Flavisolibacter sp.]|nr:T9SS type A sorting domain-containing protein [Flavisolibacter sp.]
MKGMLPSLLAATTLILLTTTVNAQKDRFAYAITDLTKDGSSWNALRKLDLQTGEYSTLLLNGADQKAAAYDPLTKKQLALQSDAKWGSLMQTPFGTGVAAAAYDKKHNRLYYTPMYIDQLRYVDLKTMKLYYVSDQPFTGLGNMHNDEAKIITRMVIAPDGYGYAISNDAKTFVRFTTGKKTKIEKLGSLVDDPANKGISIHNSCSSFGGDMVADDNGNFYIISARNNVFKVNRETKMVTYLSPIKGLPANFTVNGAAVDAEGSLLVSSAVDGSSYFTLNPKDWTAKPFTGTKSVFRSSDLANSNYLITKSSRNTEIATIPRLEERLARHISVYPNPITTAVVTLQFDKVPNGDYTIELNDLLGRSVLQKRIFINKEAQTQSLSLNGYSTKGLYLIKVLDSDKQSVFTQKVMVQ